MKYFLGIDTSNYRTSAAICDENGTPIKSVRRLLNVKDGERGLRQSDALFSHVKALPEIMREIGEYPLRAVGYSKTPRDCEGSYMPCFLAGEAVATGIAELMGVPIYPFSHQAGHLAAAIYSCNKNEGGSGVGCVNETGAGGKTANCVSETRADGKADGCVNETDAGGKTANCVSETRTDGKAGGCVNETDAGDGKKAEEARINCCEGSVSENKISYDGRFIAFHLSGGTTEALLYDAGKITLLGGTLDLNAGQVIDRVGVMLGLKFPAGEELEALAGQLPFSKGIKVSVKGFECNLAGIENLAKKLYETTGDKSLTAAFAIDSVCKTLDKLTENILSEYPSLPVLYAGGVMACKRIKMRLENKYNCSFAEPQYSGDNAVGTALLCRREYLKAQAKK